MKRTRGSSCHSAPPKEAAHRNGFTWPRTPTLTRAEAAVLTPYQVINPGIMGGFVNPRRQRLPWVLFSLHNQTLNIYSHAVGVVLFAYLFTEDYGFVSRVYCVMAATCWLVSVVWHTTSFLGERIMTAGLLLDYLGVTSLGGTSNTLVSLVMLRRPALAVACATMAIAVASRQLLWHVTGDIRLAKFGPMNAVHSFPVLTSLLLAPDWTWRELALTLLSYLSYGLGAVVHATRWPERPHPSFTVLYSHPIMHVCVTLGSWLLWAAFLPRFQAVGTPLAHEVVDYVGAGEWAHRLVDRLDAPLW